MRGRLLVRLTSRGLSRILVTIRTHVNLIFLQVGGAGGTVDPTPQTSLPSHWSTQ